MDKLPEEILIEIFTYLDFENLCNLTLTCKLFNEIIGNSSVLMDNFRLVYTDDDDDDDEYDISIDTIVRKKYRRFSIVTINESLIKHLECHGGNIFDLTINCYEIELKDLRRIFTLCPNVKQLNIYIRKLNCTNDDLTEPVMKLTPDSLTIDYCDSNFFKILHINAKKIHLDLVYLNSLNIDVVINMLRSQKNLKTLHLEVRDSVLLFEDESLVNVDFQLETLIVEYSFFAELNVENFEKFLKNQKSLARIIDYKTIECSDDCNYANILKNFENVKELDIPGPYHFAHPMPYIEKLTIEIVHLHTNYQNFHNIFPNVNDLSIESVQKIKFVKKYTKSASKYEKYIKFKLSENVKTIAIKNFKFLNDSLFDDDVDIKIENLTICYCDNTNWLIECFKNDRMKLKSLTIEDTNMKKSQQEYLESLTRGDDKKIEKLKIYMPMKFDENHDYVYNYLMEDNHDDVNAKRIKLELN